MLRKLPAAAAAALLSAALVFTGCGNNSTAKRPTLAQVTPDVSNADPRLVKIVDQSSQLLKGGEPAFSARLKELHGLPIVVNKWAEWCAPCVAEFPEFQQASKKLGGEVAFLGVDVADSNAKAKQFLRKFPVAFPSYSDPNRQISSTLQFPKFTPITSIYDADGKLVHVEAAPYESAADLESDIERYAGPLKAGPSD